VQDIVDGVWDEPTASHTTAGTTGKALTDAGSAGDPWSTALPGAYGAGTAGKIVGDNINATISSRATQTSVDTIDDFLDTEVAAILAAVDTEVAAIKAKTDQITFTVANRVDSTSEIGTGTGLTAVPWNAAWDAEVQSEVADALTVYDPPTNAEMEARTIVSANYATAANLATVDTVVDAIKVKTDSLTFTVAGNADVNIQYVNDEEVGGTGTLGDEWGPTP
jgi:hypothetical protein